MMLLTVKGVALSITAAVLADVSVASSSRNNKAYWLTSITIIVVTVPLTVAMHSILQYDIHDDITLESQVTMK